MSNPYQYGGAQPPPPTPGSDPNRQQYPYSPGIPPQTQQGGPGYHQQSPPTPGAQYGGYVDAGFQQQAQGGPYSPSGPPPTPGYQNPQDAGYQGLTAQMGQMGINEGYGAAQGAPARHGRKKQRAFHTLDQAPEASGPLPTTPGFQSPAQQQFPNQFQNQFPGQAPAPGVPNPNQFPVPANPQFQPANPPASIAEYNANMRGPTGTGRVDPELIPSIPVSREAATAQYKTTIYPTMELHHPPPALTDFVAFDQGNSSPKYCRLSLNTIPSSEELLKSTALPLSLIIQPLAPQKEQELPVPVLDFGDDGPPRCRRCRTYINPFMTFSQNGAKFVCNMCLFPNEVPASYYSPLDMTGKRVDREQRPELMRGTVEYIVPKEYWAKEPTPLRWLFAIDVSMEAINKGLIESMVKAIRQALYGEDQEPLAEGEEETPKEFKRIPQGCKVGILTYDKEVHFYNLNANLDQAQMLVMTDLEEPFVPLSEGLFVDPYESETVIRGLLDSLPNLFSLVKNPEPALFPTLQAAFTALEATGGKIICSLATLPTWGPGRLHFREDSKLFGTDKEKTFFTTEHQEWKKLAGKMVEAGIGADFFLTPAAYVDVATVGHIAEITGGEVFFYPNFIYQRDSPKLEEELAHSIHRETGYQALMKVRCSNGLQVSSYHGNFLHRNAAADLEFGVIDQDKSVSIGFSYDGKLDTKLDAHFQSALLYTTASGERRVRCHNIVAAVTDVAKEGLRFVDQDAVICTIAKEAASTMAEKSLKQIRGLLTEKCVDILAAYRKNFSGSNPPGQLVLPEALKEFGLYILCLIKLRAFRGGNVSSDMRVHAMRMLKSMSPAELSLFLYPRIIPIHNLEPEDGFADESGHLKVPAAIRASFSRIEEGGVYLVDNGQICILWLHAQTSPALLADLFGEGIDTLQAIDPYLSELPVLETHLNAQVRNLLQYFKTQRGSKALRIQLARQGLDGAEYEFAGLLVEDRNNEAQSYVDWLVHVHKHIQLEITGQRKKEGADDGISGANLAGLRPPYW